MFTMINNSIKAVLTFLLNQKCIGGKHIPEKMLSRSKTKYISLDPRKLKEAYEMI